MKTRFMLLAIFLTALSVQSVYAAGNALDGKTYKGKVWSGSEAGDPDTFIFKGGKFRSTACDQYGYNSAPYSISNKDGVKIFTATTKNKNGATMLWQGTVEGKSIEGTAIMTTKSGEKTAMSFDGKVD